MNLHPAIRHEPDPDHPGWWTWDIGEGPYAERYNSTLGKLIVRADGPGRGLCRMFPEDRHLNLHDIVHGGAVATFVDLALFAGGALAGADVIGAVTLDMNIQYLGQARAGSPLEAEVELLRETGRLAFLRGRVVQSGEIVAAFSGALRKAPKPR